MKVKKFIPLLVGLVVIWGAYLGVIFYLAHGGLATSTFNGIALTTWKRVFAVVSTLLSLAWCFVWWFIHVKGND